MSDDYLLFYGSGLIFVAFVVALVLWLIWAARRIAALARKAVDFRHLLNSETVWGISQFVRLMKPEPPLSAGALVAIGLSMALLVLCLVAGIALRVHQLIKRGVT